MKSKNIKARILVRSLKPPKTGTEGFCCLGKKMEGEKKEKNLPWSRLKDS